jgi:outer membrane protein TolC
MIALLAAALVFSQAEELPVLTLEQALQAASAQNYDLSAARARLERAQLSSRRAWAGYLPTLAVGASYTRNQVAAEITLPSAFAIRDVGVPTSAPSDPAAESPIPGEPTTLVQVPVEFNSVTIQRLNQLGAQAELRQALFAPALWATIQNAHRSEEIAELQYDAARREVLYGVARTYFGAAGLQETAVVQERLLETFRQQHRNAQLRVRAGAAPRIDELRAEIDLAAAEQNLVRTRNAHKAAVSALAALLGREPDFEVQGREALSELSAPPELEALSEQALVARPDVRAARSAVTLAEGNRRAVAYSYLPNVGFTAQWRIANAAGFTGQAASWAAIIGLNWTLWDGGLREVQLREARTGISEALAQRAGTEARARDEVRRALLELDSARANRQTAARQVELASENLSLVQRAWEAGAATSLDVSNASSALLGAELSQLNEHISAYLASLQVLKAAGAFDPPSHLPSGN